jgi:hypothetical protein
MEDNKSEVGKRIRLISSSRQDTSAKSGDTGTIWHVITQTGISRVKWDNGGKGDLDPEKDEWEVLEES